jgi:hypothetical protein
VLYAVAEKDDPARVRVFEILKDNARPEAAAVYGAMEMDWAKLVGQISAACATK